MLPFALGQGLRLSATGGTDQERDEGRREERRGAARDSSVCRTWVIRSEVLSKVAVKSNPGIIDMVEG